MPQVLPSALQGGSKEPLGQVPLVHSLLRRRRLRESAPHWDIPPRLLVVCLPLRCARFLFTGILSALRTPGAPSPSMVLGRAFPVNLPARILRLPASPAAPGRGVGWVGSDWLHRGRVGRPCCGLIAEVRGRLPEEGRTGSRSSPHGQRDLGLWAETIKHPSPV